MSIRTIVSASSAIARAGLAAVLREDARVEVVGESPPGGIAALVRVLDPDVVVEARDDAGEAPAAPTVSLVADPRETLAAYAGERNEGAYAVLPRDASGEAIVAAVLAVAAGLIAIAPQTLEGAAFAERTSSRARDEASGLAPLSPREIQVLGELARGSANKQIAGALGISEHTVKFHIASIFGKLGVASRTEAVTAGVRRGLIML